MSRIRVRINGQGVGTLFAVPFEITIGKFVRDGENSIENVTSINCLRNMLGFLRLKTLGSNLFLVSLQDHFF